jgi:hypothetical protein
LSNFEGKFLRKNGEAKMADNEPVYFDLKTVALLRETLDDAWACLPPERQARISRTLLAEGILKSAAKGERDPERLREAALLVAAA